MMAQHIQQNIRELEGSLNRVLAYARLLKTMITPELAREALEDISDKQPKALPAPSQLLETVAHYFNLDVVEIRGSKRDKATAQARQVAMYLMREGTDYSLSKIGREFGGRQPIVVSQAHKKISAELGSDPELKKAVDSIQDLLKS